MTAATKSPTESMYELEIELLANGAVNLEQGAASGNTQYVSLHRAQIRLLAEMAGLIASTPDDLMTHSETTRDQRRLRLALLALRDRGETLLRNLHLTQEAGHEDLTLEVAQAAALCDIADLACADFEDEFVCNPKADAGGSIPMPLPKPKAPARAVRSDIQAMELFEDFVRTNAGTLRMAAKFGDGECGAMLDVLQRELQGAAPIPTPKATPKVTPKPPFGTGAGPLFAEDGGAP